jgi:hypothetical protein
VRLCEEQQQRPGEGHHSLAVCCSRLPRAERPAAAKFDGTQRPATAQARVPSWGVGRRPALLLVDWRLVLAVSNWWRSDLLSADALAQLLDRLNLRELHIVL